MALSREQKEGTAFLMFTAIGNPINTLTRQWVTHVIRIRENPLIAMTVLHDTGRGREPYFFNSRIRLPT